MDHMRANGVNNPGAELKQARENAGLTQADVARMITMPITTIQSIESGDFSKMNGHTFARGYVRAYAQTVGLNPNDIANMYNQYTGASVTATELNLIEPIIQSKPLIHRMLPLVSAGLIALLLILTYQLWPKNALPTAAILNGNQLSLETSDGKTQVMDLGALQDPSGQLIEVNPDDSTIEVKTDIQPITADTQINPSLKPSVESSDALTMSHQGQILEEKRALFEANDGQSGFEANSNSNLPDNNSSQTNLDSAESHILVQRQVEFLNDHEPNALVPSNSMPQNTEQSSSQVMDAPGVINAQFIFKDTCWARITNQDGKVLFDGTKQAGETLNISDKGTLQVRLGYARGVDVLLSGRPVDISQFIKNSSTVAKFTLGNP